MTDIDRMLLVKNEFNNSLLDAKCSDIHTIKDDQDTLNYHKFSKQDFQHFYKEILARKTRRSLSETHSALSETHINHTNQNKLKRQRRITSYGNTSDLVHKLEQYIPLQSYHSIDHSCLDHHRVSYSRRNSNGETSSVGYQPKPVKATHYKKPKKYRERAPWEKADSDEEGEGDCLAGKIALGKDAQSESRSARIPSRTFNFLRRSISRDPSPGSRSESLCSADYASTGGDSERSLESDEPVKNLVYVGKNIPSKTFHKLRMSMDKRSTSREELPTTGDFDRLRNETREMEEMTKQLDNVHIENKQPHEYLEHLKESMQNNGVKIEEAEATDF